MEIRVHDFVDMKLSGHGNAQAVFVSGLSLQLWAQLHDFCFGVEALGFTVLPQHRI